jgi:tetratricopeptide (TPR) repeat protein
MKMTKKKWAALKVVGLLLLLLSGFIINLMSHEYPTIVIGIFSVNPVGIAVLLWIISLVWLGSEFIASKRAWVKTTGAMIMILAATWFLIDLKYPWIRVYPLAYLSTRNHQDAMDTVRFARTMTKDREAWKILRDKHEGDYIKQAVAMAPGNWGVLQQAGRLYLWESSSLIRTEPETALKMLTEAASWQTKALQINPQCRECLANLIINAKRRADWATVERSALRLLEMSNPGSVHSYSNYVLHDLALARMKQGNFEGALDAANRAIEHDDKAQVRFLRACLLEYYLNDAERAAVDWEKIKGMPLFPPNERAETCRFDSFLHKRIL